MNDLSLVSMEELVKEMESRCSSFIAAYEFHKDKKTLMNFHYGKGSWYESIRLASVLNNDVLNNWNGELKVLQRMNDEESSEGV
jgi:hypothetical protein